MLGEDNMVVEFSSQEEFAAARERIRQVLRDLCSEQAELLYVALNEAVNNAFFHGYCGQKPALVQISILTNNNELQITVKHDGEGFCDNLSRQKPVPALMEEHGRGLEIIRCCVDNLEHVHEGRELIMRKKLRHYC